MRKRLNFVSFMIFAVLTFTSCGAQESSSTDKSVTNSDSSVRDVFAMDTFMTLKAYGDNADSGLDEAVERIQQLESELSVTDENSEIKKINNASGQSVQVSDDVKILLEKAESKSEETNGALNICLYPILKEWGFTTGEYKIPEQNKLDSMLKNTDVSKIAISDNSVSIPSDYQIDFGALAKGYTSDEIMRILRENGVESAVVSLGGNVQTLGKKPDGSNWKVAITDPFSPDKDMCVIEVGEKAVITSGNYERFFTGDDGKNYWHIIDPKDGYPADNGLVSVTIIGDSGLDCDALSTALFVMGYPDAIDHWRKDSFFDMVLVTANGEIFYTEGLEGSFTNTSSMSAEVLKIADKS